MAKASEPLAPVGWTSLRAMRTAWWNAAVPKNMPCSGGRLPPVLKDSRRRLTRVSSAPLST